MKRKKKNTVTKGNFRKHFSQLAVLEGKIQNSEEGMTAGCRSRELADPMSTALGKQRE